MYEKWTPAPTQRERQRYKQKCKQRFNHLTLTLLLFSLVFTNPNQNSPLNQYLPDLKSSFTQLGSAFQQQTPIFQEVNSFLKVLATPTTRIDPSTQESTILVFSPDMLQITSYDENTMEQPQINTESSSEETSENPTEANTNPQDPSDFYHDSLAYFASPNWTISSTLWSDLMNPPEENTENQEILEFQEENTISTIPIGTILQSHSDENLPETHTLDYIYLGDRSTSTPVTDVITSTFGQRTNPVTGAPEELHNGVDIRAATGTDILAWSDGVVLNVGETPYVGRYIRIDHGDNITTFYAHCSEILAEEGQNITTGEVIAKAGATGLVTGSHLHLEIKYGELYLNPLHYIEYTGFLD